jgi:hypothetical protein
MSTVIRSKMSTVIIPKRMRGVVIIPKQIRGVVTISKKNPGTVTIPNKNENPSSPYPRALY